MTLESSAPVDGGSLPPRAARSGLRLNNVSELRLLFAACVVLSHAVQLSAARHFDVIRLVMNSEVAVQGFFILSGYLVFGSYDRIQAPLDFYRRRIARIYPAYFVAVTLFLALVLAEAEVLGGAIHWADVPRYLGFNLLTLNFLQPDIGGVFAGNTAQAINGALWSIKVELMFYACVPPLYALARRTSPVAVALALIAAGVLWWPALEVAGAATGHAVPESLRNQLPGQLHFFGLGLALFAFSSGRLKLGGLIGIVAVTIVLLLVLVDVRSAANVAGLVTVIAALASARPLGTVFADTDISYGIYLCHFPIIQMLLAAGAGTWPFLLLLAVVLTLVPLYGVLSWRLVEEPALELNKRWSR